MNEPTIGDIVHYQDAQGIHYPAIITVVDRKEGEITLTVFDNSMTTPGVKVSYRPVSSPKEAVAGSWWRPEYL